MSDESPTQRAALSKPLLITLISVGGAMLIAIIVLLIVLLTSGGGGDDAKAVPSAGPSDSSQSPAPTPSATEDSSPTPAASPSETVPVETPAPAPPPSNDPKIDSFTASTTTYVCSAEDIAFESTPTVTLKWKTTNVDDIFVGFGTNDAQAEPYNSEPLPEDGQIIMNLSCPGNQTNKYTLTVSGDGQKVSKSVNVVVK